MQSLMHSQYAIGHRTEAPAPRVPFHRPREEGPPPGRTQRLAARTFARCAVRLDAESARRAVA